MFVVFVVNRTIDKCQAKNSILTRTAPQSMQVAARISDVGVVLCVVDEAGASNGLTTSSIDLSLSTSIR